MHDRPAIIVMARAPRLGEGKTRLRSVLSDDARLKLQAAFVRDTVAVALEARIGPVFLAYTPAGGAAWVEREFGRRVRPVAQERGSLGDRMLGAFRAAARTGHAPLIMVGTDTPLLRAAHLRAAEQALASADLCIGPSEDGGYYLLGCNRPQPQIFADMPWGSAEVLQSTLALARRAGLRYELLERLRDIDTPEDLSRLRSDLERWTEAARVTPGQRCSHRPSPSVPPGTPWSPEGTLRAGRGGPSGRHSRS